MNDEFNNKGVAGEVVTQTAVSDKSKVLAAVLCFFLGTLGIHRFYLGSYGIGAIILVVGIIGFLASLSFVGSVIGIPLLIAVGIWVIIDFFRILFNSLVDAQGRRLK